MIYDSIRFENNIQNNIILHTCDSSSPRIHIAREASQPITTHSNINKYYYTSNVDRVER